MADESMIRTLANQAEAIWPQESRLFSRYALPAGAQILDVGCGTGEATLRLSAIFQGASLITGLDLMPELLSLARQRLVDHGTSSGPEIRFEQGDGFHLPFEAASIDLLVCRHVTQLVPDAKQLLSEFRRVLRPGGWLHVLSEDYAMLHFPPRAGVDPDRLWHEAVVPFTTATGTDARIGRKTLPLLRELGFSHLSVQYLTVDTERVPRESWPGSSSRGVMDTLRHWLSIRSLISSPSVNFLMRLSMVCAIRRATVFGTFRSWRVVRRDRADRI